MGSGDANNLNSPATGRLAILGAGGHGRSVADVAEACGWRVSLYDDAWPALQASGPWRVVGNNERLDRDRAAFDGVAVAFGDCARRLQAHRRLQAQGVALPTLVHPTAWVSPHATLGPGCIVMAGAAVNVGTSLGEACLINTGATVDHDCHLAAGVHVSPGAHLAGGVQVDEMAWVGMAAALKEGVRVRRAATVGAGAVVLGDVEAGACVVGCPARPMPCARGAARAG